MSAKETWLQSSRCTNPTSMMMMVVLQIGVEKGL